MPTDAAFIDYVVDQLALGGRLARRKMFGEYALYIDGKVVALVCDNCVFLKLTDAAARLAPGLARRPPYPGARDHVVADELLDDGDALRDLVLATAALVPLPRPKPRATTRPPRGTGKRVR